MEPKQEDALISPVGTSGTNGISVETLAWKRNPALCVLRPLHPLICVSAYHWNLKGFKTVIFMVAFALRQLPQQYYHLQMQGGVVDLHSKQLASEKTCTITCQCV